MMVNSIRAEWTKLASTKSFAWTSILIVVLSWAFAALMGWGSKTALDSMDPEDMTDVPRIDAITAIQGFELFGVMVIIIMATLLVTTEYRFKTINETIMMTPKRPIIAIAKTIVYGLVAVVLSFFSTITSVLVFKWLAGDYGSGLLRTGVCDDGRGGLAGRRDGNWCGVPCPTDCRGYRHHAAVEARPRGLDHLDPKGGQSHQRLSAFR